MSDCYHFIGVLSVTFAFFFVVFKILKGLWTTYIASALGFSFDFKHADDAFAVITGATDGIGYEYACLFAKKGYNLFLISRDQTKLDDTKQKIAEKYPSCKEIRVHKADFTDLSIYDGIKKAIDDLPRVEVLINNVGISYSFPEYLTKLPADKAWKLVDDLIHVNIVSMTRMCQIVLPLMENQHKGLVISLSSISATYPTPLLAVYGASKTYVDFLSRSLQMEYEGKGIIIQSLLPGFVSTKMSKIRKPTLMAPTPKDFVNASIKTAGVESRSYGYPSHKVLGFVFDCIVNNLPVSNLNSRIMFNNLKSLRKAAYRKLNINQ